MPTKQPHPGRGRSAAKRGALIALIAAAASWSCLTNEFVWNSDELVNQPGTASFTSAVQLFSPRAWGEYRGQSGENYHPVAALTFWLDRVLWGGRAQGCHFTNLLIHIVCCLLVGSLAMRLLGSPKAALFAALLFAVHPGHIESVNWIKNRSQLVAIAFALGSIRLALARPRNADQSVARALAVILCYVAALLAHEQAIGAGAIVAYVAWWGRPQRRTGDVLLAGLALATAIVYVALRFSVLHYQETVGIPLDYRLSGPAQEMTASTLALYSTKALLPVHYAIDYASDVLNLRDVLGSAWPWLAWLLAVGLAVRAGFRTSAASAFWFFAAVAPASNIIPILGRPFAEQRLYFPSVGACLLAAGALAYRRRGRNWLVPILIAALSALTLHRGLLWQSPRSLWSYAVAASPANERPRFNLALSYQAAGRAHLARHELETALRVEPTPDTHLNLALMALTERDYELAEQHLHMAIRMERSPEAYFNLALIYYRTKRYDAALRNLRVALRMRPRFARAKIAEGDVFVELKQFDKAAQAYLDAAAMERDRALPFLCLGDMELRRGRLYSALRYYKCARGAEPDYIPTLYNMANTYYRLLLAAKGDDDKRIYWHARRALYTDILRIDPRQANAIALLGYMRLEEGDRLGAEAMFLRAREIDPLCQPALEGLETLRATR